MAGLHDSHVLPLPLVLVAHHDTTSLWLVAEALIDCGYEVRMMSTHTTVRATAQAYADRPLIIIADRHVPDEDGFSLLREHLMLQPDAALIVVSSAPSDPRRDRVELLHVGTLARQMPLVVADVVHRVQDALLSMPATMTPAASAPRSART